MRCRGTGDQARPTDTEKKLRGHLWLSLQVPVTLCSDTSHPNTQWAPLSVSASGYVFPPGQLQARRTRQRHVLQGLLGGQPPAPRNKQMNLPMTFFTLANYMLSLSPSSDPHVVSWRCVWGGGDGPEESFVSAQIVELVKIKYLCSLYPACFSCFPARQEVRAPVSEQIVDFHV